MSPYQEVHQRRNTSEVRNMMDIIKERQLHPQNLQSISRQTILKSLTFRYRADAIPIPLPRRLKTYLQFPELSTL